MADLTTALADDTRYLVLAREIAIDLYDIETILKRNQIGPNEFARIKSDPRFQRLVESEVLAWNSAGNTQERTKMKAGALIEEFLPEANALIHDKTQPLPARNELIKTLTRIAGMGLERANIEGGGGERFTVTINLGADHKLQFQNEVTPKVIEHEA